MSVELKLSRSNRIYCPNEPLEGKIVTKFPSSISHQGIRLTATGTVNLQVRGGTAGVIESFYGVIKPICIMNKSVEVRSSGKIGSGTTEIPFSIILRQPGQDNSERFYETFHGANISIQYLVTVDLMRGYLHKSLSATMEFIIETEKANLLEAPVAPEMVIFYITQDTQRHQLLPELLSGGFRITGKISSQCSLLDPISGELTVEASAVPICSIDIHLLRVESIIFGERIATETTIADGDVCRNMTLPIYVVLPRLLTCPTVLAGLTSVSLISLHIEKRDVYVWQQEEWRHFVEYSPFSIEFRVSIVISFQSELSKLYPKTDPKAPRLWRAMETVPLELFRTK
ncbi:hypothetical protein HHK36_014844 [Tetracentron sinense]|uniref:Vacuolar protein sorting-associated protein 26C n=1 Tax=Tetracentron sinense TaxID=13715 RepID=A0A834YZQ0_TETSI|nr:hypothetical protein HHK36_014844 [Tetracentron sinense]